MRKQAGKAGLGWIAALVVILGGAGGAYYYFGRDALTNLLPGILSTDKTSANSTPLVLVKPETRMVDATVLATGIIRLRVGAEVRVGAQISGIVSKLNVTVGAHVNKGDIIAEIDSRVLNARIAQAKAQVDLDEASLQKTRLDLIRSKKLVTAGVVPHQQLEDQEAMVALSIAKVEKSKRDLAVIATDLNFVTIRASKSGTIASVSTQEGETVATQFAAPTFVTIIEDNALELIALVDETDIANVRASNPVMFTTETFPAREFAGTVQRIAPKATIVSGVVNYEVGIAIEKGLDILKPDMTANVSIKTARHKALVVPQNAVHRDGDERFVYVARDGKPEKRRITIGIRDAGFVEIKKGLKAEEQVVAGDLPAGAQEKKGMIEISHVTKEHRRGDGTPVLALKDVSFKIEGGEFVTIRGPSGSGKSSLLNILGCLDRPTSGSYRLAGEDVSGYSDRQLSKIRGRKIGFVFQSFNLLPRTTALENVEVPMIYNATRMDRKKALAALERVGLKDRANHYGTELSGGEQQRVAIARALINDPPLILADEPTGNLDQKSGVEVMRILQDLSKEGRTIVLVTHDDAVAAYAAREIALRDGSIEFDRVQEAKVVWDS